MNTADQLCSFFVCWIILVYFAGVVIGVFIGRSGEQDKRARHDKKIAEAMRANIRYYDARVEQFAPSVMSTAQSSLDTAGARTTAFAPLPPPR